MKFVARPMFDGSNILNASEIAGLLAGKSNTGHAHAWSEITSKPTTFAPSTHSHAISDVTGLQTALDGKAASSHTHLWAHITDKPTTFAPSTHTHLWADITDKPTTFAPSTHSHAWSEITSKPTTFAPSAHTHLWADITDKPTTFAPSTHSHAWSEITSKPTTFAPAAHVLATSTGLGAEHTVSGLTAGQVLKAASATTAKFEAVKWGEITSVPSSFTPSAHTHAWSEITSKPTTFAPSAHTHPWSEVTSKPNVLTQSRVTANVTTAGWYTIAQGSGRTAGRFTVSDPASGKHNLVVLLAAGSYGQLTVDCLQGLRYSTRTIAHARIIYPTADRTYGVYKLQVYLENPTFAVDVVQHEDVTLNDGWNNWTLVTPTRENLPTGYDEDSTARIDDITTTTGGGTFSYLKINSGSFPWSGITGKPPAYPPDAHLHGWDEISSKPSTFAPSAHTHPWSDLTSVPSTFAPAGHVLATTSALGSAHTVSGLTQGQVLRASGATTAAFAAIADGDLPSTIVRTTRILTAGDGLSGGGTLASDRTFTLGTPSTLDTASSNGVTATSHTHAITTSSNPGTNARILASAATTGGLQLARLGINVTPSTDYRLSVTGDVLITGSLAISSGLFPETAGYAWSAITPNARFENYGGVWSTFGVKRFGNLVSLKGLLRTNAAITAGSIITTLISAYRPSASRMFSQFGQDGPVRIDIGSDGTVRAQTAIASGRFVSLEIMYFTGG